MAAQETERHSIPPAGLREQRAILLSPDLAECDGHGVNVVQHAGLFRLPDDLHGGAGSRNRLYSLAVRVAGQVTGAAPGSCCRERGLPLALSSSSGKPESE